MVDRAAAHAQHAGKVVCLCPVWSTSQAWGQTAALRVILRQTQVLAISFGRLTSGQDTCTWREPLCCTTVLITHRSDGCMVLGAVLSIGACVGRRQYRSIYLLAVTWGCGSVCGRACCLGASGPQLTQEEAVHKHNPLAVSAVISHRLDWVGTQCNT